MVTRLMMGMVALALTSIAAQAEEPTTRDEAARRERPGERLICKREEITGSRLRAQKVCMTRGQWDEKHRQLEKSLEFGSRQYGD